MIDEREGDLGRWRDQVCYRTRNENVEAKLVVGERADRPFPISPSRQKPRQVTAARERITSKEDCIIVRQERWEH